MIDWVQTYIFWVIQNVKKKLRLPEDSLLIIFYFIEAKASLSVWLGRIAFAVRSASGL